MLIPMVIVVPSFAEGDQSQEQIVPTIIRCIEPLVTPDMGERVHKKGSMQQDDGADEKPPDK